MTQGRQSHAEEDDNIIHRVCIFESNLTSSGAKLATTWFEHRWADGVRFGDFLEICVPDSEMIRRAVMPKSNFPSGKVEFTMPPTSFGASVAFWRAIISFVAFLGFVELVCRRVSSRCRGPRLQQLWQWIRTAIHLMQRNL